MALSLPGERSIAAASSAHPATAFRAWLAGFKARRNRAAGLRTLLEMDHDQLRDLGICRDDVVQAMSAGNGRTPGMILNSARARAARY
jgi:uncharacterized protein YjiS (DUF1127 family)